MNDATKAHYGPSVTALFEQADPDHIVDDGYIASREFEKT